MRVCSYQDVYEKIFIEMIVRYNKNDRCKRVSGEDDVMIYITGDTYGQFERIE